MSLQFEWQVGDDGDDDRWETIAEITGHNRRLRRRRTFRWVWIALLAAIVVAAACGYISVRRRYRAASKQITFQIQTAVDLEARAFAEGDEDLFMAQQDQTSLFWYMSQERILEVPRDRFPTPCI